MTTISSQERVDALIEQFWKNGYLTISRKFGKYLPSPNPIGKYEVDAIAKYKKKIVIGITLSEEDIMDPKTISKINFLATRHTKYSHQRVTLFVGVPKDSTYKAKLVISGLDEEIKKNIKIVPLPSSFQTVN